MERKIVKLENCVFLQESHGAVLEFDFGATVVGGKNVTMADGQIECGSLPDRVRISKRVTVHLPGEPDVTVHKAQPDDAGMARIRCGRLRADKERQE